MTALKLKYLSYFKEELEAIPLMFPYFIIHFDALFRNIVPRDARVFVFDAVS